MYFLCNNDKVILLRIICAMHVCSVATFNISVGNLLFLGNRITGQPLGVSLLGGVLQPQKLALILSGSGDNPFCMMVIVGRSYWMKD